MNIARVRTDPRGCLADTRLVPHRSACGGTHQEAGGPVYLFERDGDIFLELGFEHLEAFGLGGKLSQPQPEQAAEEEP